MDQFIGINSFNDVPDQVNAVAGILREYHNWNWDEAVLGQIKWNPSYAGDPWNFDAWYTRLKNLTPPILVSPVIQNNYNGNTFKPVKYGMNSTDPAAYIAHGEYFYQFAARYGKVNVLDPNLKLAPGQPRLSGLGFIQYVEDWNEPDNTWSGGLSYFSPEEYAVMASVDYDGHCGKLGATVGVRNADPGMRLVMGGISEGVDKYFYYLNGIRLWSDAKRGGSLPFDVINIHHYSSTGKTGKSPEEDNLKEQLGRVTGWRDKYAPDKEVWYSEFGWDTNPNTMISARAISPYTIEQVQGQWIVRAYLLARAAGVDRAFQFVVRDEDPNSKVQFNSSGLTSPKPDYTRKPAWYYVYTLKNRLADFVFAGEQASGNPQVMIYKFVNPETNRIVYVLWSPTTNGTVVPDYNLKLDGTHGSATFVSLSDTSLAGVEETLLTSDSNVLIDVSESPVFVLIN